MKIPKPIRKHVKRTNRRKCGVHIPIMWRSPRHKGVSFKEVRWHLKSESVYCPCCGSCGYYGCCNSACSLCRPDITSEQVFKAEAEDLEWAMFEHKSGKVWRKGY